MKKGAEKKSKTKAILLTLAAVLFVVFVILPLSISFFDGSKYGNVASIPIEGILTVNGNNYFGQITTSSETIVDFIKEAEKSKQIEVILLEINSPGGGAVASDEIASTIKKVKKPVVALIKEVGASGGYWIASAADYTVANRMSVTGSIGVISSYLEFSGLMEKYGVGYERLIAGENKDMGVPFRKLEEDEKTILLNKLNRIHDFFIKEIAKNRGLSEEKVKEMATGEFFLGVEALDLGLVDQLGNKDTVEEYLKDTYGLEQVDYVVYEKEVGFFEMLSGVFSNFFFNIGEGLGSILLEKGNSLMLM